MIPSLPKLREEFAAIERSLGDPGLLSDHARFRDASRRYAELKPILDCAARCESLEHELRQARDLASDPELGEMAREEVEVLERRLEQARSELAALLVPKDPFDRAHVIVEVRAAAGGDEASLFARELLDAYRRFAERRGFVVEMLDSSPTEVGGLSKASVEVRGDGAYGLLKFESGVHRVQRVPLTETQGRIHTSTVTVAVLPEAEEVDVDLSPADCRVDVFRSSGPGGQSVNTTDSAVRITYKAGTPDEIVVQCQDGKSQLKNKEKALTVLKARLLERERAKAAEETRRARLVQIGTGERSEKIRTYNVPQSRVTDHRIGFTTRNLAQVMMGELDPMIEALSTAEHAERLQADPVPATSQAVASGGAA